MKKHIVANFDIKSPNSTEITEEDRRQCKPREQQLVLWPTFEMGASWIRTELSRWH